ncbi:pathogenicity island protein, partial [Staphylococcus aureus]
MEIKQKYQLSKVVKILEVVLYEKSKTYDDISYLNEDKAFYEYALKLVHNGLFNILAELDFEDEVFLILDEVT